MGYISSKCKYIIKCLEYEEVFVNGIDDDVWYVIINGARCKVSL